MIGFGFIGKVHAHAHRALPLFFEPLPARTRLVGVCTTSEGSGLKAQQQADFEFHTTEHRALLERDDIDLIHICTPNNAHFSAVRDAIAAGKHIYCDKPLALNVAEAAELVALAERSSIVHQMTFNYRFVPAILRAIQVIDAGFLGDLHSFRAAYLHAGYIDRNRPFSWRTDFAQSGGGAIMDLGAHVIDLTRFLLDRPSVPRGGAFAEISAELQTVISERRDTTTGEMRRVDVDDIALAKVRLAGGAIGLIEASRLATGVQDELRVELHGSRGSLRFNLMDANWLDAYDASLPESALGGDRGYRRIECVTRYPKPYTLGATKNTVGWVNFHIQSLYDFVDNVARSLDGRERNPHSPSFADGLKAQQIVAACQRSSAGNGAWTGVGTSS
jgi:predicted dehydrogenase